MHETFSITIVLLRRCQSVRLRYMGHVLQTVLFAAVAWAAAAVYRRRFNDNQETERGIDPLEGIGFFLGASMCTL